MGVAGFGETSGGVTMGGGFDPKPASGVGLGLGLGLKIESKKVLPVFLFMYGKKHDEIENQ